MSFSTRKSTDLGKLARSKRDALLWAGFWEGDGTEEGRTTLRALQNFANMVDHETVHPSTELGRIVRKNGDLQACTKDPAATKPRTRRFDDPGFLRSFWTSASQAFVRGMADKNQRAVIALVNKDLDNGAEHSIHDSVLWMYELPTVSEAVSARARTERGKDVPVYWEPQVIVVDLRGTCGQLRDKLQNHMIEDGSDFGLSVDRMKKLFQKKPVICLDCASPCMLDQNMANRVKDACSP